MTKFSIGDKVLFSRAVVKRLNYDKAAGDARGVVVDVNGPVISVDFRGTWVQHENGGTVRHVPAANLTKTLES
tara:strand:+ start:1067 stop:1285 length:219 start_codon:yes stop_codon:yes gene_type:complete